MTTTLISKFGLDKDLFSAVAETPEVFETTGRTTTLHVGRRIAFKGSINGIEVPAYATLHEATLTRMSVLKQTSPNTGEEYKIVTGVFKPVKMTIEVLIDGQTMTIQELLRASVNEAGKSTIDEATFLSTASRIGLKFDEGMPMFFQQFGASEEGIKHAFAAFKDAGAVDVLDQMTKRGNIITAYAHETGIPVINFEVGSVKREQSRTKQGFLNLVDATFDQFQRITRLRKDASILKAQLAAQTDWSQAKVKKAEDRVKVLQEMSRQWTTNWSGAQQIIKINEDGSQSPQDQYAAVNAPCGRFTMVVDNKPVSVDLWKNSAIAENNDTVAKTSGSVAETEDDELPF